MEEDSHTWTNATSPLCLLSFGTIGNVNPPFVGQISNSYDEAKEYYFLYASKVGFSVRRGTTKVVDGKLILMLFVC